MTIPHTIDMCECVISLLFCHQVSTPETFTCPPAQYTSALLDDDDDTAHEIEEEEIIEEIYDDDFDTSVERPLSVTESSRDNGGDCGEAS